MYSFSDIQRFNTVVFSNLLITLLLDKPYRRKIYGGKVYGCKIR